MAILWSTKSEISKSYPTQVIYQNGRNNEKKTLMVSGRTFFGAIHIFSVGATYLAKKGYRKISVHSPFKVIR